MGGSPRRTVSKKHRSLTNAEGVDKVDTLRQNQDFDEFIQMYKQTSSDGINALKLAVFLSGNEFRLRILFGKRFVSRTLPLLGVALSTV